ncbi:MAG: hypothetical protein K2O78_00120 [Muribaculaceae bacterium]|nr:hypothetical protein [Muribaculaceae bacterium]
MTEQQTELEVSYRLSQTIADAIDSFCRSDPQAGVLTPGLVMGAMAVQIANLALVIPTKQEAMDRVPAAVAMTVRDLLNTTPDAFFNSNEYGLRPDPEPAPDAPDT